MDAGQRSRSHIILHFCSGELSLKVLNFDDWMQVGTLHASLLLVNMIKSEIWGLWSAMLHKLCIYTVAHMSSKMDNLDLFSMSKDVGQFI